MKKFKYKIDSYLKYLKHQREEALREVHKAQAVKLQLEEKYQGTWKCTKEGFSTHVQSNVNPSKAYRYKYRLHRLDAQYMIYQRYSDGQETDFYVAKSID